MNGLRIRHIALAALAAAAALGAPLSASPRIEFASALAQQTSAPRWRVDPRTSSLGFSFTLADGGVGLTRFAGRFTAWRADIAFDPDRLSASTATVIVDTASAIDGVPLHESTLQSEAWFDAARFPTATFRASAFRREGDRYVARGDLTIKGVTRSVDLPFTLQISGGRAVMAGRMSIDRRAFDVGARAAEDDFVSPQIELEVRVEAARAPA